VAKTQPGQAELQQLDDPPIAQIEEGGRTSIQPPSFDLLSAWTSSRPRQLI
jgi:hypothetical protein